MLQQPADTVGDRQPQTEPLDLSAPQLRQALELMEHARLLVVRNPRAGVPDLDGQRVAATAAAEQHPAALGVTHRVGEQILEHPTQQRFVGAHLQITEHGAQGEPLRPRQHTELLPQLLHQRAHRHGARVRLHGAGIQTADLQQRGNNLLGGTQRAVDMPQHFPLIAERLVLACQALGQGRGKQLRGVQRLHQVVAGGGQEAGLALVGLLQLAVQFREPPGALGDHLLQVLVDLAQGDFVALAFGDVHVGADETAALHGVAAHLHDHPVGQLPLEAVGAALAQ